MACERRGERKKPRLYLFTIQGHVSMAGEATLKAARGDGERLTSREKIQSMRINCQPCYSIHVGRHGVYGFAWEVTTLQYFESSIFITASMHIRQLHGTTCMCTCVSIIESNVFILMASHNDGQSGVTNHLVDLSVWCTICTDRKDTPINAHQQHNQCMQTWSMDTPYVLALSRFRTGFAVSRSYTTVLAAVQEATIWWTSVATKSTEVGLPNPEKK